MLLSDPRQQKSPPENKGFPFMNIGIATPSSGNYLQILPSLNFYFMEDDDMTSDRTLLAAIEIGWLGWALWLEL